MNKVYVCLFDNMDSLDKNFFTDNLYRLPKFRQEQCAQYRQKTDKRNCVLAYLLLEQGLWEQYSIMTPISFKYNEHGKPYLSNIPNIFFNISHCKSGVVCALADFEIGVDIQDIQPFDIRIAQEVCSEKELQQLADSDNSLRLFYKIWTEKESYAKAKGVSVAEVIKQELPPSGFSYIESTDYFLTIYSGRKDIKISNCTFAFPAILR